MDHVVGEGGSNRDARKHVQDKALEMSTVSSEDEDLEKTEDCSAVDPQKTNTTRIMTRRARIEGERKPYSQHFQRVRGILAERRRGHAQNTAGLDSKGLGLG